MSVVRVAIAVMCALPVATAVCLAGESELPYYIGQQACLECHAPDDPAGACSLEPIFEHDQSYAALSRPEAEHIAALSGLVEPPPQSHVCLGCHSAAGDAGTRWTTGTFDIADGVQCESCHEAGSLHADAYRLPEADRILDDRSRMQRLNQSMCTTCHRARTSHRAVLEEGYRRPVTDAFYRTPVNLVTSPGGDLLYVVCENANSLIVVDPADRQVLDEIPVGHRPRDVAVSPDGKTVYVTNRMSDSVSVIDAATREVVEEIAVGDEPHGVLTDPTGRRIYVLNTGQDSVSVIDAGERKEIRRLVTGRGPWSLALRADGASLCVTNVWPHHTPFREPSRSEVTIIDVRADGAVLERPSVAEANMLEGIACVSGRDVALFTLMRTKNLVPGTRLGQGWTITNGLGILWPDGRVDQVLLDEPNASFSDPTDVAVSPDGRHALVTGGGADQVAVVDVDRLLETITAADDLQRSEVLPNHLGMSRRFVVKRVATGSNPRGVVFSPDGRFAYVANALDDSVSVIEAEGFTAAGVIDLGGPEAVSETRWGEKLFHSAKITFGRQFSCRSCHPDGHASGLTFDIEADGIGMNPVDNRTLRGILDTAPFKWEGNNPSLSRQCGPRLAVFFTRLSPYTPPELGALVRYISTIERPVNRYRRPDGLTLAQRRGKAVFERTTNNYGETIPPERRCINCHNGPYQTSGAKADVGSTMWFDAPVDTTVVDTADLSLDIEQYGELGIYYFVDTGTPTRAFDVPHLNNIYDSGPYLHNGAAATLEEIWTRLDVLGEHGVTDDLTRRQLNDLIAYLKAL
ncbi:MAG: YVTN family beta-propeller repeat protein [Planctomycetota bacterium]|jgi:YVTN family beta-propeller protein